MLYIAANIVTHYLLSNIEVLSTLADVTYYSHSLS